MPITEEQNSKFWEMNRLFRHLLLFLLLSNGLSAQEVKHSIYLIGDAGKDTLPGQALLMLEEELKLHPNSTTLFLGDNIYPAGLTGKDGTNKKRLSELKLLSQLERTADYPGYVFWLPGNHDWKAGRWQGHWLVNLEADFVEEHYAANPSIKNESGHIFLPKNGFPGPSMERVSEHGYDLIAIDIQWWLQDQFFHKVPMEEGMNKKQMENQFLHRLDSLIQLSQADSQRVIIAAHHPMYSNGHHGAPKQPLRFIFNWIPPFQLFGLAGLNRAMVQDIHQFRYKRIRNRILEILNKYEDILYVSGHDHNLQYIKKEMNHYLISGSGSKRSSLKKDRCKATFMDDRNYGFMRLDILDNDRIQCHVFGHTVSGVMYSFWLD